MNVGRGRYAIACYEDGGIFIDGVFFRLEENKYWYVQPDGPLETWLKAHQANYNVLTSNTNICGSTLRRHCQAACQIRERNPGLASALETPNVYAEDANMESEVLHEMRPCGEATAERAGAQPNCSSNVR